jgi:hypothetical protein
MIDDRLQVLQPPGRQVVDDGHLVTAPQQVLHQVTPDEPRPARHSSSHEVLPFFIFGFRCLLWEFRGDLVRSIPVQRACDALDRTC